MAGPERQTWEYRTTLLAAEVGWAGKERIESCLDELGRDGWELVSVLPGREGSTAIFVFKRPVAGPSAGPEAEAADQESKTEGITLDDLDFDPGAQPAGSESPVDRMIKAAQERMKERLRGTGQGGG